LSGPPRQRDGNSGHAAAAERRAGGSVADVRTRIWCELRASLTRRHGELLISRHTTQKPQSQLGHSPRRKYVLAG